MIFRARDVIEAVFHDDEVPSIEGDTTAILRRTCISSTPSSTRALIPRTSASSLKTTSRLNAPAKRSCEHTPTLNGAGGGAVVEHNNWWGDTRRPVTSRVLPFRDTSNDPPIPGTSAKMEYPNLVRIMSMGRS